MLYKADIRSNLTSVREGLDWIRLNLSPDWIPEDVYLSVRNGWSELWLDREKDGFLILQEKPTPSGERCLLIWIAYSKCGDAGSRFMDEIVQIATSKHCGLIEVFSPRRGMGRLLEPHGFRETNIVYTKRIT